MSHVVINDHITANPAVCHGKPVFKGTRIMVWQILDMLAAGDDMKAIKKAFSSVTSKHVAAALEYARSLTQQNYVMINTQTPWDKQSKRTQVFA